MLKYTGHPLVDVGAATIAASAPEPKRDLTQLTAEDLESVAKYIAEKYSTQPFRKFISVLFANSGYVNASWDKYPEKRAAYANMVLRSYKPGTQPIEEQCAFCEEQATNVAFKQHIPLLGGEKVFNFFPEGRLGVPVCGRCLLSIQAFPLGSTRCNGRALIVHSPNPDLTYEFASRFLAKNREYLQLAGLEEIPNVDYPKTMLIEILVEVEKSRKHLEKGQDSLTAYHLTNYGTNPDIDIYHLPLGSIDFIQTAISGKYRAAWNLVVERAWRIDAPSKPVKRPTKRKSTKAKQGPSHCNHFYEDLFALPDNAQRFLRVYFLRMPLKGVPPADPRGSYSLKTDVDIVSWELTSLFLRKVMNMDKVRIEAIRQLGDRLVDYVQTQDARLFTKVFSARRYRDLSLELLKANKASVQAGKAPLFSFNDFVEIFEESEDTPRADWSLARDLVLVRMIEQLHAAGWFPKHQEQVEEATRDVAALD